MNAKLEQKANWILNMKNTGIQHETNQWSQIDTLLDRYSDRYIIR